ncbi:hypothetical protein F5X68DRAFT_230357 [Plectosphaerella plurivora]|uniref:Uncharacterized protein n=1 Tax=Plectosphaerella plurivora TaxID=936078 RepID=A0A9P9AC13_9PEZI|nr:hypothetical protein F5X68DRAFT_230357 [Plectosphaerella plurivora]
MSRCPGARDLDSTQKVTIARIKHVDFLDSKNDVPADTKLDDEKHCLLLEEDTPRGWIVIQCINRLGSRYFERSSMVEHSALYVGIHAESFDPVFAWGGSNFLRPDDEFFVLCSADEIIFDEQHLRRKDGTTTAKLADELPFSERKSKVSFSQLLQDPEFRHRQEARDERFLTGEPHVVDCDPANLDLPVRLAAIEGYSIENFVEKFNTTIFVHDDTENWNFCRVIAPDILIPLLHFVGAERLAFEAPKELNPQKVLKAVVNIPDVHQIVSDLLDPETVVWDPTSLVLQDNCVPVATQLLKRLLESSPFQAARAFVDLKTSMPKIH